jgi:hypothetical protein
MAEAVWEADFSATPFAKARTASVEMTMLFVWVARTEDASQKQVLRFLPQPASWPGTPFAKDDKF